MPTHRFADPRTPAAPRADIAPAGGVSAPTGRRRGAAIAALAAVIGFGGLGILVGPGIAAASHKTEKPAPRAQETGGMSGGMSGIFDPSGWYLTLPTGHKGDPDTVAGSSLPSYSSNWFQMDSAKDGIVFTADAGGVTTSGSKYPRSELREMDGGDMASWSDTNGTNTLTVRQAVTSLTKAKPEVVTAQIHDSASDVIEIRLEGSELIAQYNDGKTDITIDPDYTLGNVYDLKIVAADGRIQVFYNGVKKVDIAKKGSGWYFKSGCYLQSNTSKGDKTNATASVVIYQLAVTHTS